MLNYLKKLENFFNKIQQRFPASEQGQSIVLVALFLFFVFLAFAALATDGTTLYLRRRQLQNMADAAALVAAVELSQTKPITAAYTAAMNSIAANGGQVEWYAPGGAANPPTTNVGTGSGLTAGIEIGADGCTVRVALAWTDIGTYFAQFVGRESLQAGANARAGCNKSGGLMPIAMKRFGDEIDVQGSGAGPGPSLSVWCEYCNTRLKLSPGAGPPVEPGQGNFKGYDFFRRKASDADIIPDWPGWYGPPGLYQSPSPHATNSSPGRDFFFLGNQARATVGTGSGSWQGAVNLDIRRPLGSPTLKYYNGVTAGTGAPTLKDMGSYYIRNGYCCDIPKQGDWVAMFPGVSGFPVDLQKTYAPGDIIAIIIYDGSVRETPTFLMTGTPDVQYTYPTTTTIASNVLTYTFNMAVPPPDYSFASAAGGLYMEVEGLDVFADYSFSPTSRPVLPNAGVFTHTVNLIVTPTLTTTTVGTTTVTQVVTGTRMFYVSVDNRDGVAVTRYFAGIVNIGDGGCTPACELPAVTGTPTNSDNNYPYLIVEKGKQAKYVADLNVWGVTGSHNVKVQLVGSLPTGFSWVGPSPPWTTNGVVSGTTKTRNIKIAIDNSATASTTAPYTLPFLVTDTTNGVTSTFNLYIWVEEANATTQFFAEILGYAAMEIEGYYNSTNKITPYDSTPANTVKGRFVSELQSDPSSLIYGLRARLIPWD